MEQALRESLQSLELTQGMPASAFEQLASIATPKAYPAGRVLFNESEYHPYLHILLEGLVSLEMRVPGHGTRKILTLGRGDFLAWSAFLTDGVMTTSAMAEEDTKVVQFSTDALRALCEQNHELGYYVMRQVSISLARRLLATRLQLLDLFHDVGQ
jgi:CRP/FNR family transcriptional regulator, cyclic AMP receptor protein